MIPYRIEKNKKYIREQLDGNKKETNNAELRRILLTQARGYGVYRETQRSILVGLHSIDPILRYKITGQE